MADTFKGIITADGKKRQLPYSAVLDKPVSDKTLSEEGGFADSKAVGDKFAKVDSTTASLKEDLVNLEEDISDISYGETSEYNYTEPYYPARYIDINTGAFGTAGKYYSTKFISIDNNVSKIIHNFTVLDGGIAGWAIYDKSINPLAAEPHPTEHFLKGGKELEIENIPSNAGYIIFTTFDESGTPTGKKYKFEIGKFQHSINNKVNLLYKKIDNMNLTITVIDNKTYNYLTGVPGNVDGYFGTDFIEIPYHAKSFETNVTPNISAVAGWCLYDNRKGYISGGMTQFGLIPDNAAYIVVCGYKYSEKDYWIRFSDETVPSETVESVVSVNPLMVIGYINSTTGKPANTTQPSLARTDNYITIPNGTVKIRHNCNTNTNSAVGWTFVDSELNVVSCGVCNKNNSIPVPKNAIAFAISNFNIALNHDITIDFIKKTPFSERKIAFDGDSITFGFDPDKNGAQMINPWVSQVGAKIMCDTVTNYGVSSASLMYGKTGGGSPTPKALVREYVDISNDVDILGIMIGINDYTRQCTSESEYRTYPLGEMSDRTEDTFYGALHVLILGLLDKFKPINGKRIFFMIYPYYDRSTIPIYGLNWEDYMNAVRAVCDYYAVPVFDLEKELGISQMSDINGTYWPVLDDKTGTHNAHPRQACADVIAVSVSNYINRMFAVI